MKTMTLKIGITDYTPKPHDVELSALPEGTEIVYLDGDLEETFRHDLLEDLDALLVWHKKISEKEVSKLNNCKIIVRYGVGYDALDLNAIGKRNIPAANTPDYGTEEVADTALAMILGLQRKIFEYDFKAKKITSGWQEHTMPPLQRMNQITVGIVGVGRIGSAVAARLKPFGCNIMGYDPNQPSGHEKAIGYKRTSSLEELLENSDIVTIHCPLSNETEGMVNEEFISKMKQGSILVNTARGGLIASLDPIEKALKSGKLYAAGLDVIPQEPPSEDDKLIKQWKANSEDLEGRLIINPHSAYFSEQAWYEMRYKAAETIKIFFETGKVRNQLI